MRTQVGIIGAGPAGLLLSHLLHLRGISSVVLETRSREYVERRVRAGVLEQGTVDTLIEAGVGARLLREGLPHHGIELRYDGAGHRIAFEKLVPGRAITVYGQQEVVKDLIAAAAGGGRRRSASRSRTWRCTPWRKSPYLTFGGERLDCDVIAGCDGFHGGRRPSIPAGRPAIFERDYPFAWLGILAEVAAVGGRADLRPDRPGLRAAQHALARRSAASTCRSRPDADARRVAGRADLGRAAGAPGDRARIRADRGARSSQRTRPPMRSFVAEPMRYGSLYLAGDAAHIVPPTGAKGLNLAVADVRLLTAALADVLRRRAPPSRWTPTPTPA